MNISYFGNAFFPFQKTKIERSTGWQNARLKSLLFSYSITLWLWLLVANSVEHPPPRFLLFSYSITLWLLLLAIKSMERSPHGLPSQPQYSSPIPRSRYFFDDTEDEDAFLDEVAAEDTIAFADACTDPCAAAAAAVG